MKRTRTRRQSRLWQQRRRSETDLQFTYFTRLAACTVTALLVTGDRFKALGSGQSRVPLSIHGGQSVHRQFIGDGTPSFSQSSSSSERERVWIRDTLSGAVLPRDIFAVIHLPWSWICFTSILFSIDLVSIFENSAFEIYVAEDTLANGNWILRFTAK